MYCPEGRSNFQDMLTWRGSKIAVTLVTEVKLKMENINSWFDVNWPEVNKRVYRLQLRIYRASRIGDRDKMHKLQNLLLKGDSAKFLAVRNMTQKTVGKTLLGSYIVKDLDGSKKLSLAKSIFIDGKSKSIRQLEISKQDHTIKYLESQILEDRAKQALVLLALQPEWEAKFEPQIYGFRPGRIVNDALEDIFLSISKKPTWVLNSSIDMCFDTIDYNQLINKCDTFPSMERQLRSWIKLGILRKKDYMFPEMGILQTNDLFSLLFNIVLHGLNNILSEHLVSIENTKHKRVSLSSISYIRYDDKFVIMHPNIEVVQSSKLVISEFLRRIGLRLSATKTKIAHTFKKYEKYQLGFEFLGFNVIQRIKYTKRRRLIASNIASETIITLINPSKEVIDLYKQKLRETIKKYRGISQENLIYHLNSIIRDWVLSKRTLISSKVLTDLDKLVYLHLWKWAVRRHPKMPKTDLKNKYWHTEGKNNWVFGIKSKVLGDERPKVTHRLQKHSEIKGQRHVKIKGNSSPYDGNISYWSQRTQYHTLLPSFKASLVRKQKGICTMCYQIFLPGDIIENDYIIPKALGGKNIRENVHAIHDYCHRTKTI